VNVTCRCICLILVAACLVAAGCKKKGTTTSPGTTAISQDQIDAARDMLTRDMQKMAFTSLKKTHVGKNCVVVARTMEDTAKLGPPPPPLGMVRLLGQTTIYRGELDDVSSGSLTIRAAYPTAGRYKKLEIAKEDIQSIHLAP
jgi:hypothetical protein